jgi:hypothetical protein
MLSKSEFEKSLQFGRDIYSRFSQLQNTVAFTDFHGQLGLAGACIANGLTTEREIAHFFNTLDQDGYLCDVSLVLDRGAGMNRKRRLWTLTPTGHYELRD